MSSNTINTYYNVKPLISNYIEISPDRVYIKVSFSFVNYIYNNLKIKDLENEENRELFLKKTIQHLQNIIGDSHLKSDSRINSLLEKVSRSLKDRSLTNPLQIYNQALDIHKKILQSDFQIKHIGSFEIGQKDFENLGYSYDIYQKGRLPNCYDFVFYKLNEFQAARFIFSPSNSWPTELWTNTTYFLKGWGYNLSASPEDKDLIVYHSDGNFPFFKHIGLFTAPDKVLSKFGSDDVYEHPIRSINSEYGNHFSFYRKAIPTQLQASLLKALEEIEKKTCTTTLKKVELLNRVQNASFGTIFENSFYNQDYCVKLKNHLYSKISTTEFNVKELREIIVSTKSE